MSRNSSTVEVRTHHPYTNHIRLKTYKSRGFKYPLKRGFSVLRVSIWARTVVMVGQKKSS
jgi:hypothetical protein